MSARDSVGAAGVAQGGAISQIPVVVPGGHLFATASYQAVVAKRKNPGPSPVLLISQPAAASADGCASVVVPIDLAVTSSPLLFISNLCFRSKPLTNSRAALAIAPGRLDASTLTVDSRVSSFRSL